MGKSLSGKVAVYPGTFDPVTYGHIDIIRRASKIFSKVIVGVSIHSSKEPLFSVGERVNMLKQATKGLQGVRVCSFSGLAVRFAHQNKARVIIRGLRMLSDFEYEFQMALTNRTLAQDIETIFMMPHESYSYISSRLLKEAVGLGADISKFVPSFVQEALRQKVKRV